VTRMVGICGGARPESMWVKAGYWLLAIGCDGEPFGLRQGSSAAEE
jgi:hypothetical protein